MAKLSLMPPAESAGDGEAACQCRDRSDGAAGDRPLSDGPRPATHDVRRGVADANHLHEHGVTCSLSSNNILNPATPLRRLLADPHR